MKYLKAKGFNEQILTDTGLIRTHDLDTYAVFDNRLMIPIHDENGNPVIDIETHFFFVVCV